MYQRIIGRDCTGAENFRFRSTQERSNFLERISNLVSLDICTGASLSSGRAIRSW